jgi:hypothetical protein
MELLCKAPVLSCLAKRGAVGRWIHRAVIPPPPPPRICGTPGGPPVTAPRVRLSDGRHLAYAESGVSKEEARFKVVFSHGFTGSRLDDIRASPVSRPPAPRSSLGQRFRLGLLLPFGTISQRADWLATDPSAAHSSLRECVAELTALHGCVQFGDVYASWIGMQYRLFMVCSTSS